ncbi:MAG TPA: tripartite tricarboxylate transporter substrate binding protein [Geminicoccaceae bacterium]|nr:tripartite tricarboxylate transporter substrate binding protein [Geminicoccus sp.]HMU51363.1 tripartite tricarboxylate transporter substrate binding protein [Geminicoccaceae bacterium]
MRMVKLFAATLIAGGAALASADAGAAWPEKPIRIVIPFAPGGTSDQIARIFQKSIEENNLSSQPLTIVNIGGHYSVGARQAKDAPADGYNFLVLHVALMGGEGSGAVDFGYRDFDAVATTSEFCLTPAVMESSPIKTTGELVNGAKANPDSIVFGVNIGAINHMAALMLQETTPGARFRFVQVGGGAENFKQLAGGHTQAGVFSGAEYMSFKDSGVRALGWSGGERHPKLPDLPTLKEQGFDVQFCVANWWFAPKGTPQEAIDGMAAMLQKAMETPYVRQELDNRLFDAVFLQGDAMRASLDETWARIEPVAKLAAVKK